MKKVLLAVSLLLVASTVYAACTTHTLMSGGKILTCQQCCDSRGNCTTTCF